MFHKIEAQIQIMRSYEDLWKEIQQLNLDFNVAASLLQAVSQVEMELGEVNFRFKLSDDDRLYEGAMACCNAIDNTVTLSREYFSLSSYDTLETIVEQTIRQKFHPQTRMRVASVVVHELCHAVFNEIVNSGVDLVSEVLPLMKKWIADNKMAHMTYASSDPFEYWAEMLTQELCGASDSYSAEIMALAHKYRKTE